MSEANQESGATIGSHARNYYGSAEYIYQSTGAGVLFRSPSSTIKDELKIGDVVELDSDYFIKAQLSDKIAIPATEEPGKSYWTDIQFTLYGKTPQTERIVKSYEQVQVNALRMHSQGIVEQKIKELASEKADHFQRSGVYAMIYGSLKAGKGTETQTESGAEQDIICNQVVGYYARVFSFSWLFKSVTVHPVYM